MSTGLSLEYGREIEHVKMQSPVSMGYLPINLLAQRTGMFESTPKTVIISSNSERQYNQ